MFNDKVNRIRDALLLSESNLILYLGLRDIETLEERIDQTSLT